MPVRVQAGPWGLLAGSALLVVLAAFSLSKVG
jgi:hypothetical protein